MTLVIAVLLYKRFGLEPSFIEKQANKVLELADLLKGKVIRVKLPNGATYLLRMKYIDVENEKKEDYFQIFYNKTILISFDDYFDSVNPIFKIGKSYWLPNELKQHLSYLEFYLVDDIKNPENEEYVRFDFGTSHEKIWGIPKPKMTVEQYIINNNKLILSIDNWLKKHSDIQIDLKLDESAK